jgi:methionyl-tRNA synthetase
VAQFLNLVEKNGDVYFGEYGGHYCFGCERFYTEKELVDGLCPDHQTKPEFIAEKNYFFRMSNYQDWLIDYINQRPDFIRPERYRNEVLGFLRDPLEDLCISRPKSRLIWGIDLPFDNNFVTYVWFDALINYISALGWPDGQLFAKFWPAAHHTIAKDILKPHAIFWPTMLKSAGVDIYKHLNVHGYWRIGASKMSKSVGNVVEALTMADKYGSEAFRYFLMREMNFGLDSDFSEDRLVGRFNSDLANDLGNLWQRSLTMVQKFSPYLGGFEELEAQSDDQSWGQRIEKLIEDYQKAFEAVDPRGALQAVWEWIGLLNKTIDEEAPWLLAKDPLKKERLKAVLKRLLDALALIGALIWPVMPLTGEAIWRRLGLDHSQIKLSKAIKFMPSSSFKDPKTLEVGSAFFPRIEAQEPTIESSKGQEEYNGATDALTSQISFEDFKKIDLRVAKIIKAEKIKKSDKLIKLTLSLGLEERTVVAGIGQFYSPDNLIGLLVIAATNLAPVKLMGIESKGMVLASSAQGHLALLTVSSEVPVGSKVS